MKRLRLLFTFLVCSMFASAAVSAAPRWTTVKIGIVGPASVDVLRSALDAALAANSDGLLIELDTPGGSLESTREMVKDIMAARLPVVVWVGPDGARAGSAGAFITLAGHYSAMAPGTNIGASHPVQSDGSDVPEGNMAQKVENDTVAFIESIAKARGKNPEVAASFVVASVSLTADEALTNKVIDHVASSPSEFLSKIDGQTVDLQGDKKSISSKDAQLSEYQYSLRQKFLQIVSNPNLFYLLFLAGIIGLGFELTHPGSIFPGVFGAICLTLALVASSVLPVSIGAGVLVICGVAFIVAEMFLPSFGVLGIGGFIAFVAGSVLLVDPSNTHGLRISLWMIVPTAVTVLLIGLAIGWSLVRTMRQRSLSGQNSMVGQAAEVISIQSNGEIIVRIWGEIWTASANANFVPQVGTKVRVESVDGMRLRVNPIA